MNSVKTFYDIETYPNLFLIEANQSNWDEDTFIELENPTGTELMNFISNRELIGFFNHGFDDVVLSTILTRLQASFIPLDAPINPLWVYQIAQELIQNETDRFFGGLRQPTEDVMKYRDFETQLNLKSFENLLMMPIIESSFPFDQPLPKAGIPKTKRYCKNDVKATRRSYEFLKNKGAVNAVETLRNFVAEKLQVEPESLIKSGTNSLMIKLFKNPTYNRQDFFDYIENCGFDYAFSDPNFVEWYNKIINWADDKLKLEKPELEFVRNGVEYKFALGGGHGHNEKVQFKNVKGGDFESLYPWILINILGLGPQYTALYQEIVETRIKAKKTNKQLAAGLKLAINSLYGLTRSLNNGAQLYNKYLGLDICIVGQVMLYDMALRMEEAGATLVNINTDGILYVSNGMDALIEDTLADFSKRVNIGIDFEDFPYYFAENVNSYFCFDKKGKILKAKKTFTKKPYYSNLATPNYVMNYFIAKTLGHKQSTWEEMFYEDKLQFILRAKNNKTLEFNYGIAESYPRYGKKGKRLKHDGVTFYALMKLGQQYRGYATKDGYTLKNLNNKTGKFTEITKLKTGMYTTNFSEDVTSFDELNLDYYSDQAASIIAQIESNKIGKE